MAFNRTLQHFTSSQELATVWETGKSYILNQVIIQNNILYLCTAAHLSDTFSTDLSQGKWTALSSGGGGGGSGDLLADGSVAMTNDLNFDGNTAINLSAPQNDADAATKKYVDDSVGAVSQSTPIALSGNTININWNDSDLFIINMTSDVTVTFSNVQTKIITVVINNTDSLDHIITFPLGLYSAVQIDPTVYGNTSTVYTLLQADTRTLVSVLSNLSPV